MMPGAPKLPTGVVSLDDYESRARERLDPKAWAYISGGAGDERTLAWNRDAFDALKLRNRVLADLSNGHTRLELLGVPLDFPILLAPVALQGIAHPEGELETARAAAAMHALMIVSTEASRELEAIAAASDGPQWFQLYIQPDRAFTLELVRRAESAGYRGLVITADAPVTGTRPRERRAGSVSSLGVEAVNMRGARRPERPPVSLVDSAIFDRALVGHATWDDVGWLRGETRLPLLLKGVTDPRDAARAVSLGVDGLIVSNHGGRTLDTVPAAIDVLPAVAAEVGGRVPIVLDGGIRRGTDVVKAVARGATAVAIGRPYVYGLAVAGGLGVAHVLHLLRTELEVAMALTGCATLADITSDVLW